MKILYTATVLSHICQFHLPYLQALQEKGVEVHVAARDNLAEKNGLTLKYTDRYFNIPFQRSPKDIRNLKAYAQLKELLHQEYYDVIVCNTPMGGIITRLAAQKTRKQGTKVIYMAHGFHFYQGAPKKNWLVFYPIEKFMARYCDVLITINEEDYDLARKKFHTRVEHIHGVGVSAERYHPVSDAEYREMRRAEGLSGDDFVILCTGELNENKDQKTLIAAAAKLKDTIPNLKVLLAGNGPLEQALREQIRTEHLENIVQLLGYRTDLEKVVPAVDLVVSCSHREGMGLNIIEAMLCEKPVVAAVNRGHRELVEHEVNGYLIQPSDVNSFAKSILDLYLDREKRSKMGRVGYDKAIKYTVAMVRRELLPILEKDFGGKTDAENIRLNGNI